jgi:AcrR family transcriptional regulator
MAAVSRPSPPASAAPPTRRPANRKALIVLAAADLFRLRGFHNVAQEEIAAAVGISGPALYRHFAGKQDLLAHAVDSGFQAMEAAMRTGDLPAVLAATCAVSTQRRDIGALWQRETRNLPTAERRRARRRLVAMVGLLTALVRAHRPELSQADAELLGGAVAAILASPSHHQVEGAPGQLEQSLLAACTAVAASDAVPRPALDVHALPPAVDDEPPTTSRRELLVRAATEMFSRRGYHEVSLSDIGAAAGITGPSVYKHFASKPDLLFAALDRGAEALERELARVVAEGRAPDATLAAVVESYVGFALGHPDLVATLVTEVINLPAEQRHTVRAAQHRYVAQWQDLVRGARPDLDADAAALRVHAALGLVNDVVRIPYLTERADIAPVLTALAAAVLAS